MAFAFFSARRAFALLFVSMFALHGCVTQPQKVEGPAEVSIRYEPAQWSQLPGWRADRLHEAWGAFLQSCSTRNLPAALLAACEATHTVKIAHDDAARAFFEANFTPYRIVRVESPRVSADTGLVTGYYEPLLRGSRKPSPTFSTALYAPPDDMLTIELGEVFPELKGKRVRGRLQGKKVVPYFDRAALATHAALKGKELVWVDDAVDAFFLEVQGSGRVQLSDGTTIRLAYADQNGHPYRSVGRYLVDQGVMTLDEVTAPAIREWLRNNPTRLREVLNANPSVVFFREEQLADPSVGPRGSLGVPLTAGRSIAVDRSFIPLGAPIFLATTMPSGELPLQRLVLAQDTGGAIRGPVRADLFWGFGDQAGELAGRMKQDGQMWLLWPKGAALPSGQ
jgi:membrane-bound lytic murein transglycosylase A